MSALPTLELAIASRAELEELMQGLGHPRWRARQILDWRARGVLQPDAMGNLPLALRQALEEYGFAPPLRLLRRQCSQDGTRKYLFALREGGQVETVMIPERERVTVCISSQVGCVLDCPFCHTGRQRFERNLTAAAIVAQVWMVRQDLLRNPLRETFAGAPTAPTHLVYMGMGEPLANEAQLRRSLDFFLDPEGMHLSRRRITVSTSGLLPQLRRLAADYPVNLAISLHAADDATRDVLVPVNRTYPLAELRRALDGCPLGRQRHITLEYVMLDGVNDRDEDARRLLAFADVRRERVNLLRFHPHPGSSYRATPMDRMESFAGYLLRKGLRTTIRRSRGEDIMAACGQLRAETNTEGA